VVSSSHKRGLGKGLSALIPDLQQTGKVRLEEIPLDSIMANPNQPRKHFDAHAFEELVSSVKEHGLVQPIVVRPNRGDFELVAGERRWRAAQQAGLKTIPAIVKTSSDAESLEIALIENVQREDLNALEEATAYRQLIDQFNLTHEELANRLGKSRVAVTNTIRLLQLSPKVQQHVVEGSISSGHARALLGLPDESRREKLAERVMAEGLSVRQVENIVRLWSSSPNVTTKHVPQPAAFKSLSEKLEERLSTKVKIKMVGKKGKIEVEFESLDDLQRIFKQLTDSAGDERFSETQNN
jgi:ParB family chromosome partitioning protein